MKNLLERIKIGYSDIKKIKAILDWFVSYTIKKENPLEEFSTVFSLCGCGVMKTISEFDEVGGVKSKIFM